MANLAQNPPLPLPKLLPNLPTDNDDSDDISDILGRNEVHSTDNCAISEIKRGFTTATIATFATFQTFSTFEAQMKWRYSAAAAASATNQPLAFSLWLGALGDSYSVFKLMTGD